MSFSVSDIVSWTGGRLVNAAAPASLAGSSSGLSEGQLSAIRVERAVPLAGSSASDLAFFFAKAYQKELPSAAPGILITGEPFVQPLQASGLPLWNRSAIVACADPYLAMAILSGKFAAKLSSVAHCKWDAAIPEFLDEPQVHASAIVHAEAVLGRGVVVGAHCVVESGARIGAGTVLYPGCFVGPDCVIGENCVLFPRVTLYEWTHLGNRVRIHAGGVIGSDGFGYAPKREGKQVVGHQKIYHLGKVVIGDDVEIGANSCVDRGTFGETRLENNVKLDNQVHIGHNAFLDEGAVVCGGTCLAGRASVGKYAYVGGLTGIANDVHVGDGASIGAMTLLSKDVPPGSTALGNPQREFREHFKAHAMLNRLVTKGTPAGSSKDR
jgi:UDP-3-O-[3-hydroxymyristoyl] glucosamine N-acyltransferase